MSRSAKAIRQDLKHVLDRLAQLDLRIAAAEKYNVPEMIPGSAEGKGPLLSDLCRLQAELAECFR